MQTVHIHLQDPAHVVLEVYDSRDQRVSRLVDHNYQNQGDHYKRVQTRKLDPGIYRVFMWIDGQEQLTTKMTVH